MSSLKAFGFQVRKAKCDDAQSADASSPFDQKASTTLPWLAPSDKKTPIKSKPAAAATMINLPSRTQSAAKDNTITRYFARTQNATPQDDTSISNHRCATADVGQHRDEEEACLCVVRKQIPIAAIWSTLLEEYSLSSLDSDDSSSSGGEDDDDADDRCKAQTRHGSGMHEDMMVLDLMVPRGIRRKTRDDDEDVDTDQQDRRQHSRSKMSKLDLVSAFQQVLTINSRIIGVPVTSVLKEMEQEQGHGQYDDADDDGEDRHRNVRKRMTKAEAATLFQLIADEFLMY